MSTFTSNTPSGPVTGDAATPDAPLAADTGTDLVVDPGVSHKDGCPVLRRLQAFVTSEGVPALLRYTFRDRRAGTPLDLDTDVRSETSGGLLVSESPDDERAVLVKFREVTALGLGRECVTSVAGRVLDAAAGTVLAPVPKEVRAQCGVYEVGFGYVRRGTLTLARTALLSVERSLFGFDAPGRVRTEGPPTLGELRLQAWDSDPADNPLLGDVEFSDEQLVAALVRPVQYFDSAPPPLGRRFDTRDFPWKDRWIDAAVGHLHRFAANYYRRNNLPISAGGKQLNDLGREREYNAAADRYLGEWQTFVLQTKGAMNAAAAYGSVGSSYGGRW